jgi:hypothetical protein
MRSLVLLFLISGVLLLGHLVEGAPQANNTFKVPMGGTASDCSLSLGQRVPELEEDYEPTTGTDQVQAFRSQQYHTWVFFNKGSVVHAILTKRNVKPAIFSAEEVVQLLSTATNKPPHLVEEVKDYKSSIDGARNWVTLDFKFNAMLIKSEKVLFLNTLK